jgi:threonyl-tRNA synthetase
MLVVGDREVETQQVNLRLRDGSKPGAKSVLDLIALIEKAVSDKSVL